YPRLWNRQWRKRMTIILKWTSEVLKEWKSPILLRGDYGGWVEWALYRYVRIVPADAAIVGRRVIILRLVHHHNLVLQREVPMSKADWYVKLVPSFVR